MKYKFHYISLTPLKRMVLLLFFLCGFAVAFSQNYKDDIIKMNEKYQNVSFKMNIEMQVYHWNNTEANIVEKGIVKKQQDNYHSEFGDKITFKNKKYNILVLKNEKIITYLELANYSNDANVSQNQMDILTSFKTDTTNLNKYIKLISSTKETKTYEIPLGQNGIEKMHLKISANYVMQQVTYFYEKIENDNPIKKVIITYSNVVFNPKFLVNEFSEKQFFTIKGGKAVVSEHYKEYTIKKQLY